MTKKISPKDQATISERSAPATRSVAVIDIGTSAIRMAIAEIRGVSEISILETLSQAVQLGRDTFTKGFLERETVEECIRILKSYQQILSEYQITKKSQLRVVATSAVREADNRLAFVDRIYSATGIEVEPIEEAEVNRITYLSIQPLLKLIPETSASRSIITEVGGGSTEVLVVRGTDVDHAHTYRLGSLRLRESLEAERVPFHIQREIIENQIEQIVQQIVHDVPSEDPISMIAIGGDVRFAANQLISDRPSEKLVKIPLKDLEGFVDRITMLSPEELVKKYHLSFSDAETLGPALLSYLQLAHRFHLDNILVTRMSLRDGLLQEMAREGLWSEEFNKQIVNSAMEICRKFQIDIGHAKRVAELSLQLFEQLKANHQLDAHYGLILEIAALLHEIGLYVSNNSYHKHTMYLIRNSELFGLNQTNVLLVALVARYHRRALPKPTHDGYASLNRDQRIAVSKLASLLRVAEALDRSRSGRIRKFDCEILRQKLILKIHNIDDITLEQLALKQAGKLFEETFGMQIMLRADSPSER